MIDRFSFELLSLLLPVIEGLAAVAESPNCLRALVFLVPTPSNTTPNLRSLEASQVILLDATDSPHFSNLCSSSYDFDANVGLGLNRGILVVCELRWRRIGVIFHITRNQMG